MNENIDDIREKLYQEYRLIHIIFHRNKNQHRAAIWWRQFSEFKRSVAQVLELLEKRKPTRRDDTRLFSLLNRFSKKQKSKMYYGFNGIIALGQFVTLGVVLIGLLARVYSLYSDTARIFQERFISLGCVKSLSGKAVPISESRWQIGNGEELGEEVFEDSVAAISSPSKEAKSTLKSSKSLKGKKKSKKKRSAIDDIFG